MDVIISALLGGFIVLFGIKLFNRKRVKEKIEKQSIILVKSIEKVCKLVSVEGNFSEIHTKKSVKKYFLDLIKSEKKAVLTVNAKVQIGYDLTKVKVNSDIANKTIFITDFPNAELLSIDLNAEWYDKTEGLLNQFSTDDLTEINREVKQVIVDKIPESGLYELANKEMLETLGIIKSIVETVGWELDTTNLELPEESKKLSE